MNDDKQIMDKKLSFCCTNIKKQARKSSEDTQVADYARFEKVWAG